jgi:hypothetical protein
MNGQSLRGIRDLDHFLQKQITERKQGGTLGNRGRPLFPFLPGFGSFLDPPASEIGGVPPIGTALVTEFCSASHPRDHDSFMAVVGVALGAAWPASLPRDSCRFMARAREIDPPAPPVRRAEPNRSPSRHVARRHRRHKKEPQAGYALGVVQSLLPHFGLLSWAAARGGRSTAQPGLLVGI